MVNFVIVDHGVEGPYGPERIEMSIDGDSVSLYTLRDFVDERLELAPDSYTLVIDGEILVEYSFEDAPAPTEIHLYRELDDDVKVCVVTTYQGESFHSVFTAGTTVGEYQRFLARRFLVNPAHQVLYSMKILMYNRDNLGTYAAGGPVRICLQVVEEMARPDKVFISVKSRREPGYLTFVMDDVETFDMLAGRLEREGEVREGEEVTFVSDGTTFENWRTLREYRLTHAKLRISE